MKFYIILLVLLVVLVSGCTAGPGGLPGQICTPGEKRCTGDNLEQCNVQGSAWAVAEQCQSGCNSITKECYPPLSPDYSVSVLSWPSQAFTDARFTVEWKVNSKTQKNITHTAVHYGYASVPNARQPTDYPSLTTPQAGVIPGTFSTEVQLTQPGTLYMRAHAIIDGQNYWSDEKVIVVKSLSGTDNTISIVNLPAQIYANDTLTITWKVDGAPSTATHTAIHYDDKLSHTGTFGSDVTPALSGYPYLSTSYASGSFSVPRTFTTQITPTTAGRLYLRAHAVIGGKNLWTDEKAVDVIAPAATQFKNFTLEADDNGFYPSSTITVTEGDIVSVTFKVRTTNVDALSLRIKSNPIKYFDTGGISPGGQKTVTFTADQGFTFTSYWPAGTDTGEQKASGTVVVALKLRS